MRKEKSSKKVLDQLFSKYIRLKYSKDGIVHCYTCNKPMEWKRAQAGHFIPRNILVTRFSEDNVRPQCVGCNIFGRGKTLDFEENLIEEIGAERVARMKQSRFDMVKLTPLYYATQCAYYKQQVESLQ